MNERALLCIQRNINRYMEIKTWSWWRLFARVTPLLNVQRTEEELHNQAVPIDCFPCGLRRMEMAVEEVIEELRGKLAASEKALAEQRLHCDRLQARVSDIQVPP